MRTWTIALAAALGFAVAVPTPLVAEEDPFDHYEQYRLLKAERHKARSLGGYSNPFTALGNLLSGKADERDVTRGIHDLQGLPGHEGVPVNRPADR